MLKNVSIKDYMKTIKLIESNKIGGRMKLKNNSELKFDKKTHSYYFKEKKLISITEMIKRYTPPFDKKKWSAVVAKREKTTTEEILKQWQKKASDAVSFGNRIHHFADQKAKLMINEFADVNPTKAEDGLESEFVKQIDSFWRIHPEIEPVESEKKIFSPEWKIAGTIDLIARSKEDNLFYIFDWKTSKAIETFSRYKQNLKPPLNHLDNCNFNIYALQMSFYRMMLEQRYGFKISGQYIIHISENGFKEYPTGFLQKECMEIINRHKEVF